MKSYKKSLLYGFMFSMAYVTLMGTPAPAQVLSPESNSNAGAASSSDSRSRASSGSVSRNGPVTNNTTITSTTPANQTFNTNGNSTSTNANNNRDTLAGGTSNSNYNQQGGFTSSDNIVRTTPTVYAPPVSGGNPCTLAVSGGVSVIGWGAAAGGTFVDQDCANRQKIAMIWNAGFKLPAKELMCNDRDSYVAFKTAGEPCAFRQQFEAQGATPQPVPTPIGPQPVTRTSSNVPPAAPPGRFVCMDMMGRVVKEGTPGASCGQI